MVFAAGLGTRMRPLTLKTPKPLIEVAGKALIDHMLDRCAEAGVARAIVNVHYLADQVEAHVFGRTTPDIVISDERALLLDQGGGIKTMLPMLGEKPFLICNTDAFWLEGSPPNLARLGEAWDAETMDILLLVAGTASSVGAEGPGDFTMDAEGRLTKREEGRMAPFVYAGVGIVKPGLFAKVKEDVFKLAPFFFEAARRGRLHGVRLDGLWLHVGTPQAIGEAEAAVERARL
jgi:MurNAc alpha-1-phosphate uridylyltransferase